MKIFVSVVLAFLFVGCSDNVEDKVQKVEQTQIVKSTVKDSQIAVAELKAEAVKDEAVADSKAVEVVNDVTPAITKAVEEVKNQAAKEVVVAPKKVEAAKKIVAQPSLNAGKTIFAACAGCHGSNGEKAALGKSQIIKGWSVVKVISSLNGYKNGTYGGAMKGVMKGQASRLSDADIRSLAEYISSL